MTVERIQVKDYRNARLRTVELKDGCNAFVGANARGKTNLLEAVYFAGVGKSFRTPRERELINADAPRAYIKITSRKFGNGQTVSIIIDRELKKRVAIDNVGITRMSELMGVCPVVLFYPDGLKIVKEAPADRRRFMDIANCQMSKAYFHALSQYNKILMSRHKLLKSGGATDSTLAPWDELLCDSGAVIVKIRREFVKKLDGLAAERHAYLSDGKESLSLEYEGAAGENTDDIKAVLGRKLVADRDNDLRLRYTHSGPHKDDIKITVNGVDVRAYGSQGQQRTVALGMNLAEMQLYTELFGTSPVLLLDDVLSELDETRRDRLLRALDGFQSIVTATDGDCFSGFDVNIIEI